MVGDLVSRLRKIREAAQTFMIFEDPHDILAIDFVVSTVASHFCGGLKDRLKEPVWGYLAANPGAGKSTILSLLMGLEKFVFRFDGMSPRALISGYWEGHGDTGHNTSMLPFFNHKVLCVTDFTTSATQGEQDVKELFGLLRKAYDGEDLCKVFGNQSGVQRQQPDFGMLVGTTPVVLELASELNLGMGERFITMGMSRRQPSIVEHLKYDALKFLASNRKSHKRDAAIKLVAEHLTGFIEEMLASKEDDFVTYFPTAMDARLDWLQKISYLVAVLRSAPGDNYKNAADSLRVLNTLLKLMIVRSKLDNRTTFDVTDAEFVARVAHDTVPVIATRMLAVLLEGRALSASDVANRLHDDFNRVGARLAHLVHMGLLSREGGSFSVKPETLQLLRETGLFEPYLYPHLGVLQNTEVRHDGN